jgi:hypothetical protein
VPRPAADLAPEKSYPPARERGKDWGALRETLLNKALNLVSTTNSRAILRSRAAKTSAALIFFAFFFVFGPSRVCHG